MKNDKLIGVERIEIELADTTLDIKSYTQRYKDIVNQAVGIIKKDGQQIDEVTFFKRVWLLIGNRICKPPNEFLWYAADNGMAAMDCNSSAFFIYDIGNQIGIRTNIVLAPEHLLIKTDSYYFETTSGVYYLTSEIDMHWLKQQRFYEGHDPKQIHAISYNVRGHEFDMLSAYMQKGLLAQIKHLNGADGAIQAFDSAIKKMPNYAVAYNNRGHRKLIIAQMKYDLRGAIDSFKDCDLSLQYYPEYWKAYDGRASARYLKLVLGQKENPDKIRSDFSKALEIIDRLLVEDSLQKKINNDERVELLKSKNRILWYLQVDPRLNPP